MDFHCLIDDRESGDPWHIGDIAEIAANWQFDLLDRAPAPLNLTARVAHPGIETDFSIGWRGFMFMSERARQAVKAAGVRSDEAVFHPVSFENYTPAQQHYAVSFPKLRSCVDEERSDWSPCDYADGETPISRGFLRLYGAFFELVIDAGKVAGLDAFRVEGAQHIVIVSEKVRDAFVAAKLTGATFTKVS